MYLTFHFYACNNLLYYIAIQCTLWLFPLVYGEICKIEINRIKYYVALKTEKNILNHLNF